MSVPGLPSSGECGPLRPSHSEACRLLSQRRTARAEPELPPLPASPTDSRSHHGHAAPARRRVTLASLLTHAAPRTPFPRQPTVKYSHCASPKRNSQDRGDRSSGQEPTRPAGCAKGEGSAFEGLPTSGGGKGAKTHSDLTTGSPEVDDLFFHQSERKERERGSAKGRPRAKTRRRRSGPFDSPLRSNDRPSGTSSSSTRLDLCMRATSRASACVQDAATTL